MTLHRLPGTETESLPLLIESILFVAQQATDVQTLALAVRRTRGEVTRALDELDERYADGGIRLQRDGDLVQLVSAPEAGPYVERFLGLESHQRLSGAALESLAIIAYKQPMTRAGVEAVRGVNSDAAIASLLGRGLVEEIGRAPGPGRPALFGTTFKFLEHFGLSDPSELPPLANMTVSEDGQIKLSLADLPDDEDDLDEDEPAAE